MLKGVVHFLPKKPQLNQLSSLKFVIQSLFLNVQSTVSRLCSGQTCFYLSTTASAVRPKDSEFDVSAIDFDSITKATIPFVSTECSCTTLRDLLKEISYLVPHITRRLWRMPALQPHDLYDILVGIQKECEGIDVRKEQVELLWRIFGWINDQNLKHFPESCEIMALMLLKHEMLRETQLLLLTVEKQGILLDNRNLFCELLEGYVSANDLDRALLVYDQMRERSFLPTLSCYCGLITMLVKIKRTISAYRKCTEMIQQERILGDAEMVVIEDVVVLHCREGMIHEARNLLSKIKALGLEPSSVILDEIACGYCDKMDFNDLLRFVFESKSSLSVIAGNKIINSLCFNGGVERGNFFRLKLERTGFRPDKITFGILIGWCCKEGNLKSAFIYLSEMLKRGLKPDIMSYNALLGGIFKKELWQHAHLILEEMIESGIAPTVTTFKILIAGYSKCRKFDHVKLMVHDMVKRGLAETSSLLDPLAKGFAMVGMDPQSVSVKRDNTVGLWKMEFFDNLGNGLYLEADLDEFEKNITGIFEDSYIPNFDLLIRKECGLKNFQNAFLLIDQLILWGQSLSLDAFLTLLKCCSASYTYANQCSDLITKFPEFSAQLDVEVLNFLIKIYCKKKLIHKAKAVYDQMQERKLEITSDAYAALFLGFSWNGNRRDLGVLWCSAQYAKWTPKLSHFGSVLNCLLHHRMLTEAVELFRSLLTFDSHLWIHICHLFIEKFTSNGFATVACVLVKQLHHHGFKLDDVAYSNLINGFCMESNHTSAVAWLDTMLALNLIPCLDTSLSLIPILCSAGKHEKALELDSIYPSEILKAAVHNSLIRGMFPKRSEDAIALFRNMCFRGLSPDNDTHNMVLSRFCKDNNLRRVWEMLGTIIKKRINLSISSYRHCLKLLCSQGKFSHAFNLMECMLGECKSESLLICNILMFNLFLVENTSLVNALLNIMWVNHLCPDEVSYNILLLGFSRGNDISSCESHFSNMISYGFRPRHWSLSRMVNMLFDNREFVKVINLSRKLESKGWILYSSVQNKIVESHLSLNKFDEAEHFLDRIFEKRLIGNRTNYDYLIKKFCCYGKPEVAIRLMDRMLKSGNDPDSTSYDSVIQSLCLFSQIDQAMDFHAEMLDRGMNPSSNSWDILVQKLCQLGRTVEAENLLMFMRRFGGTPSSKMYSSVIEQYRIEHNLEKVANLIQMMQESGYEPDFAVHWSLINRLSYGNCSNRQGFLSRLLSEKLSLLRDVLKKTIKLHESAKYLQDDGTPLVIESQVLYESF